MAKLRNVDVGELKVGIGVVAMMSITKVVGSPSFEDVTRVGRHRTMISLGMLTVILRFRTGELVDNR